MVTMSDYLMEEMKDRVSGYWWVEELELEKEMELELSLAQGLGWMLEEDSVAGLE